LPCTAGESPADTFADAELDGLLRAQPRPTGLVTARSREFLRWRYGNPSLGYRVMLTATGRVGDGLAVFRQRRRGKAVEGVLCDVLAPHGDLTVSRALARRVARATDADYLIRIDARVATMDPFVNVPRMGPVLTCRPLDGAAPPTLREFSLTMGDVELF
jgi:hypothetical protein